MIKTLIVDDESLARERIISLLKKENDIEVVGECSDGEEALQKINSLKPDLVFLDIQMPLINGIEVIKSFNKFIPQVIFVTAYDEYAVEAFEMNALDYLLKPFDQERFSKTLDRARQRLLANSTKEISEKLNNLILTFSQNKPDEKHLTKFVIKSAGKISFINVDEINYIEAEGNYLILHTSNSKNLYRDTITNISQNLNPEIFIRIHRSYIVKIENIKEMQSHFNSEYIITLKDNTKIKSGRSYKAEVERLLKH
ncbi:MAG: LytTR family DNA-binding domain-containing protein [Ignavibacteria bacterium]|jgi:two-component system LytT family response regulator|nr:LytTR family DNA-binding domain-containing protein [Ignavibacteria bacterium]